MECDDKDACTTNACEQGVCKFAPIIRCCNEATTCDDQDVCTIDLCTGPGGTCTHEQRPGCCNRDEDCDDRDPCTANKCDVGQHKCTNPPLGAGCCRANKDCDDGNACTTDVCKDTAACVHAKVANCWCATNADCPLGDRCVDHACQGPLPDGGKPVTSYASSDGTFGGASCAIAGRGAPGSSWLALLVLLALGRLTLRRAARPSGR
jgi:hypothetical protein